MSSSVCTIGAQLCYSFFAGMTYCFSLSIARTVLLWTHAMSEVVWGTAEAPRSEGVEEMRAKFDRRKWNAALTGIEPWPPESSY